MMPETHPYGSWSSPITAELVSGESVRLGGVAFSPAEPGVVLWTEGRPWESGRNVLVRGGPDGRRQDLVGAPYDVRSRVHEYGGGAFLATESCIYFVHDADQQVYAREADGAVRRVSAAPSVRFADPSFDHHRQRLVLVSEDHRRPHVEPRNALSAVWVAGDGRPVVLASGMDFYASPRVSPDGTQLAWVAWNHPNMPWDGTELWVAHVKPDGSLGERVRVAGGFSESVSQPEWSPDGVLHFVSDRSGYWHLHRWVEDRVEALTSGPAEFGRPHWGFANPTYGFASSECIVCSYVTREGWRLARLDARTRALEPFDVPYTQIEQVHVSESSVVFVGGAADEVASIIRLDLASGAPSVVVRSARVDVDAGYLSRPFPIEFPTSGDRTAYGLFYPPRNPDCVGPTGERPPLRVISHGGPTAAADRWLQLKIQFWTSRGIAVLDVDYGGSSGYGRAYRERLNGAWGLVDVDDCVHGARYLVERGDVDVDRLAIEGGSASGFTTLCALVFHDVFRLGACYYGVSDLEVLARDTHKFESRYLDRLVGPYPARRDIYRERSPIHHVERLASPVIFFQGLEDKVVPPNQTERMVEALRDRRVPVARLTFEGEQHGFRRADTIRRALEAGLYFYGRILGFEPADALEAIPIDHLPD